MNKKHIVNIKEKLLFLSICRHTLCEMYDNIELKKFIVNEATDYQIISTIVNNKIPYEKNNPVEEKKQWEIFQHIISNKELFIEMNLNEVDGDQGKYVQGLYDDMKISMKKLKSSANKEKNAVDPNVSLDKVAVGTNAGAAASVIKFTAAKAYKDYLIKAKEFCNGRPDKIACMNKSKQTAMAMRIEKLRSGISTCNKAKNADACKKSLQNQLDKLQSKVKK